jgi:hypothetical protein
LFDIKASTSTGCGTQWHLPVELIATQNCLFGADFSAYGGQGGPSHHHLGQSRRRRAQYRDPISAESAPCVQSAAGQRSGRRFRSRGIRGDATLRDASAAGRAGIRQPLLPNAPSPAVIRMVLRNVARPLCLPQPAEIRPRGPWTRAVANWFRASVLTRLRGAVERGAPSPASRPANYEEKGLIRTAIELRSFCHLGSTYHRPCFVPA